MMSEQRKKQGLHKCHPLQLKTELDAPFVERENAVNPSAQIYTCASLFYIYEAPVWWNLPLGNYQICSPLQRSHNSLVCILAHFNYAQGFIIYSTQRIFTLNANLIGRLLLNHCNWVTGLLLHT
jgi:hypothetical protein